MLFHKAQGPGDWPRPHGDHTGLRGATTPPRRPHGAQERGHAPRRPNGTQETGHTPTAATRGPGGQPRPHGRPTGPRGPAPPPRRPHRAGLTKLSENNPGFFYSVYISVMVTSRAVAPAHACGGPCMGPHGSLLTVTSPLN